MNWEDIISLIWKSLFLWILLVLGYNKLAFGEPDYISKDKADKVALAMREVKNAQIRHDCENSFESYSELMIKELILESIIKKKEEK